MTVKQSIIHHVAVLIAGGGPAGLILALQLANHGVDCLMAERNADTTSYPKMDITNCRSMELFRRLGIAEGFRQQGVPQDFSFDVLFSTGLAPGGELVAKWDLPSPNYWRERIRTTNDGTMPREPYQRCSQAVLEAWLKPQVIANQNIDARWGLKFESFIETATEVISILTDTTTGEQHEIHSQYLVGCDGASSRVRRGLGINLNGGLVGIPNALIHFKSRDLTTLHKQGQFWHIFFSDGGAIISQDEVDTWTIHCPIPPEKTFESLDPVQALYDKLGAAAGTCPIQVDEILLFSKWQPSICYAEKYTSPGGRILLAGDAAHQNIPTGGYGMNTAVGDSFDLGWKLAALVKGYGGPNLITSYEAERLPVAKRNIARSGDHMNVHFTYAMRNMQAGPQAVLAHDAAGQALRDTMLDEVTANDGENKDHGIELGYRYNGSPIVVKDSEVPEPQWSVKQYVPSTWPGSRAPHVWLADGKTSIFDLFGPDYTLVDFTKRGAFAQAFEKAAKMLSVPLKVVPLPAEQHVRDIWEREAVLIRPDDQVAWRAQLSGEVPNAVDVLKIATGHVVK